MSFSKDQESIVLKTLSHKPHQYYEILSVSKTADDGAIKKSYRKLAVKLHPDKNPHPRAAEAFKYVNKAWGVLSDPSKKRIYDQTGSDPDSRFAGASNDDVNPFAGFQRAGAGGVEEDLFNMFFGGGVPNQAFTFGGNGFTFQTYGGSPFGGFGGPFAQQQARRRRPQQNTAGGANEVPEISFWDNLRQLLPILMLLLVPLISNLFSGDSLPQHSFVKTKSFSIERTTPKHKVPFYVDKSYAANPKKARKYDRGVEEMYISNLRQTCSRERQRKEDMIEDAHGWFSVDEELLRAAESLPMPNCDRLRSLNLL